MGQDCLIDLFIFIFWLASICPKLQIQIHSDGNKDQWNFQTFTLDFLGLWRHNKTKQFSLFSSH